jgi:hypothetical protein
MDRPRPLLPFLPAALLVVAAAACSAPKDAPPPAPAAAAAAPAGPAEARSRAEGEHWTAALEASGPVRAGEPAEGRVRVTARGGYHVNEEYPMSFRPAGGAGARFSGERVALAPREKTACGGGVEGACEVTAPLAFVPEAPGEVRIAGTLAFSVCTAERCLIEKAPLAVSVAAR